MIFLTRQCDLTAKKFHWGPWFRWFDMTESCGRTSEITTAQERFLVQAGSRRKLYSQFCMNTLGVEFIGSKTSFKIVSWLYNK